MGSLDFAVQLRSSTFDVSMADALIFDVPVELGLELVAVVGSDLFDAERELFDDVIDEVLSVGLSMFVVDFERPDARRVIDSSILEPADLLAALAGEGEELDVHLDVVPWNLFSDSALCVPFECECHAKVGSGHGGVKCVRRLRQIF